MPCHLSPSSAWHALAYPSTFNAEVTFSRKPSPVPPARLYALSPVISQLSSPPSTVSLCYISASPTRLWSLGGLGAELWHLSVSIAYHGNWTCVQGLPNEFMHEWVNAWDLCLPLGYEKSPKDALLGRAIFKEISIPFSSVGLPYTLAATMPHPSVRASRTGTHVQRIWELQAASANFRGNISLKISRKHKFVECLCS